MANRVGKYKLSKRDSALSLADGGAVTGNLTVTGTTKLSALSASTDPGVAGQLFVTTSLAAAGFTNNVNGITGSADFVLVSRG